MLACPPMKWYPVFLRVEERACLVVGGGPVAERKVESLLAAGAQVTVVTPALTPSLAALVAAGTVTHRPRPYRPGDLQGFLLAFAATGDPEADAEIAREAEHEGVLLNVVDTPPLCSFISPSILVRGDLLVAVSTGGASPALAGRMRRDIDARLGPEYDRALDLLARLRHRLQDASLASAERQRILTGLVNSELLECLRSRDTAAVDRVLARIAGDGISLATLGVEL